MLVALAITMLRSTTGSSRNYLFEDQTDQQDAAHDHERIFQFAFTFGAWATDLLVLRLSYGTHGIVIPQQGKL
jgi:hypothetical protein